MTSDHDDPTTYDRHAEVNAKIAAGLRRGGRNDEAAQHELYAANYRRHAAHLRASAEQPEHVFLSPGEVMAFIGATLILAELWAAAWIFA